jgi:hypothetical protein
MLLDIDGVLLDRDGMLLDIDGVLLDRDGVLLDRDGMLIVSGYETGLTVDSIPRLAQLSSSSSCRLLLALESMVGYSSHSCTERVIPN